MALPSWAHFSWSVLATTLAAVAAGGMAGAPPGSEVPAHCVSAHIIAADPETRTLTLDIRNSCQAAVRHRHGRFRIPKPPGTEEAIVCDAAAAGLPH